MQPGADDSRFSRVSWPKSLESMRESAPPYRKMAISWNSLREFAHKQGWKVTQWTLYPARARKPDPSSSA
jgi:hypothetical protein